MYIYVRTNNFISSKEYNIFKAFTLKIMILENNEYLILNNYIYTYSMIYLNVYHNVRRSAWEF